ncbi:MAG: hypothetical protein JNK05_13880 [Myxococcales bacterium]|nr:hypothetical protein [Myxococcales bacterium]
MKTEKRRQSKGRTSVEHEGTTRDAPPPTEAATAPEAVPSAAGAERSAMFIAGAPWSEDEARARVGARALERGRLYDNAGALFDLRLERTLHATDGHGDVVDAPRVGDGDVMFTARCEGSGSEVYRVRARRAGPTTIEAHCSCPVGDSGSCKHAAALLLYAAREPESFVRIEPLDALCERAGGGPLAVAICDLVARVPELEAAVRTSVHDAIGERAPWLERGEDPRLFAGEVFRSRAGDSSAASDLSHALAPMLSRARAHAINGAWLDAVRTLRALASSVMARSRRFEDHDGALRDLAHTALEALGRALRACAEQPGQDAARALARDALFDAWRYDAENGTVFGRVAGTVLSARASDEDRAILADVARRACDGLEVWARRVFEGALVDLEGDALDDEVYLERCREARRPREIIVRLLQRERVEDALIECGKMGEAALVEALEHAEELGFAAAGERLVDRLAEVNTLRPRALAWLRDRLIARGDPRGWDASARLYLARPDRLLWRTLRDEAGESWTERRAQVLESLSRRGGPAWVEALIDEAMLSEAIAAASTINATSAHDVRVELAERVAKTHTLDAAELLRAQAEALILLRGRPNYREAARVLRRARELYESVGQRGRWVAYAESLRARARELPALKEELAAALARPAAIDLTAHNAANDNAEREGDEPARAAGR